MKTRVVLFVGGPEDGHVIDGEDAEMLTTAFVGGRTREAGIGHSKRILPSRLWNAIEKLDSVVSMAGDSLPDSLAYFGRLGVDPMQCESQRYTVTHIEDGLYVMTFNPE